MTFTTTTTTTTTTIQLMGDPIPPQDQVGIENQSADQPKSPIQEAPASTAEQFDQRALDEKELYFSLANDADSLVAKVGGILAVTSNPDSTEETREGHLLGPQGEKVFVRAERGREGGAAKERLAIEVSSNEEPKSRRIVISKSQGNQYDLIISVDSRYTTDEMFPKGQYIHNYWWPSKDAGINQGFIRGERDLRYFKRVLSTLNDPAVELIPDNIPQNSSPVQPAPSV